jgi:hypothetical protein
LTLLLPKPSTIALAVCGGNTGLYGDAKSQTHSRKTRPARGDGGHRLVKSRAKCPILMRSQLRVDFVSDKINSRWHSSRPMPGSITITRRHFPPADYRAFEFLRIIHNHKSHRHEPYSHASLSKKRP